MFSCFFGGCGLLGVDCLTVLAVGVLSYDGLYIFCWGLGLFVFCWLVVCVLVLVVDACELGVGC